MRVATWNLQHDSVNADRRRSQHKKVLEVDADVWVLTEAETGLVPVGYEHATSEPIPGSGPPVHFTILATKSLERLPLPEVPTGVAGLFNLGDEAWLVVGICMPWRLGAPPLPASAAPGATTAPEQWTLVLERLDVALQSLRSDRPKARVLLAGDFNQTLGGHVVGSHAGRAALSSLLARHELSSTRMALSVPSRSATPWITSADQRPGSRWIVGRTLTPAECR